LSGKSVPLTTMVLSRAKVVGLREQFTAISVAVMV